MQLIKTRFAPSPTGMMHIGSVRTALYAYLLAKKNQGAFILRIEDTDRGRFVEGSSEEIIATLKWLGLNFDEGPIYQSTRLEIYKEHANKLVENGFAYQKDGAIWFKTKKAGKTSWVDAVGGKTVSIENSLQDDFVMIKSDGYPTYNFAVVIDDHLMEITHIIRGVEFIPSTPKHIMIYEALGWSLPTFVHLPLILGTDRSKLSKRHGAQAAADYKKDGFLPEAILNYMAFLGWTPKSGKEILTLEEMAEEFDLENVHIAPAVFDFTKLEWMNGEYIRKTENEKLKTQIFEYTRSLSDGALKPEDHPTEAEISQLVPLIKERIKKLSDFVPLTDFIFEKPEYDKEIFQKLKISKACDQEIFKDQKDVIGRVEEELKKMEKPWASDVFEKTFRDLAEELGIKAGDMFQLLRVLVSGQLVTPPLFECIKIIGEEEVLKRISQVVSKYPDF